MNRLAVAALTILAWVIFWSLIFASDPKASTSHRPSWIAPAHWATAVCESRGNFRHRVHRADGWWGGGAWSWYGPTWNLDRLRAMPRLPWRATPRQQYTVYLRSLTRGRYFGCNR